MSLVIAMVVATLLSMLLGELVPKNMAIALSFPIGKALARPQLVFTAIFKPAIVVLNGFSNKVLQRLRARGQGGDLRRPHPGRAGLAGAALGGDGHARRRHRQLRRPAP